MAADTARPSPWARPGFIAASAFIAAIVVLAVILTASRGGTGSKPAPAAAPGSTPSVSVPAPFPLVGAAPPTGCPHLSDTGTQPPQSAPAGIRWQLYQTVAEPSSRAAGPAVVDGPVARCYAHTPDGALMAAAQIPIRATAATDWKAVTEAQTVGPGRAPYLAQRTRIESTAGPMTTAPGDLGQIAGFRFVAYSPALAVIDRVLRFGDGSLQVSAITVAWSGGDWKWDIPSQAPPATGLDSLDGYVPWGGV